MPIVYLASFVYSGNHLLRTGIEFLTGLETEGTSFELDVPIIKRPQTDRNLLSTFAPLENVKFQKIHEEKEIKRRSDDDILIFLTRHPTEAIGSAMRDLWPQRMIIRNDANMSLEDFQKNENFYYLEYMRHYSNYAKIGDLYATWEGPKLHIRYEQLAYFDRPMWESICKLINMDPTETTHRLDGMSKQYDKILATAKSSLFRAPQTTSSTHYSDKFPWMRNWIKPLEKYHHQ